MPRGRFRQPARKFRLQGALCLQKFNHFRKISPHFLNGLALGVRPWKTRNTTDEQACLEVAFDDSVEVHARKRTPMGMTCRVGCQSNARVSAGDRMRSP